MYDPGFNYREKFIKLIFFINMNLKIYYGAQYLNIPIEWKIKLSLYLYLKPFCL